VSTVVLVSTIASYARSSNERQQSYEPARLHTVHRLEQGTGRYVAVFHQLSGVSRLKSEIKWWLLTRICKRLRGPGIDSKESIPPTNVAWRAVSSNRFVVSAPQERNRFLGSLTGLQIRALHTQPRYFGLENDIDNCFRFSFLQYLFMLSTRNEIEG
jgi:hypothetical protein